MRLKGTSLLQLGKFHLLFFFTLPNRFTFSLMWAQLPAPLILACYGSHLPELFLIAKVERKEAEREEGKEKRGRRERAVPGEGSLNAGGIFHSLLLLPLVAEPDAHHVFLEIQLLGDGSDLLGGGPWLDGEVGFQRALFRRRDGRAFALLFRAIEELRFGELFTVGFLSLLQPRLQDRLESDHVVV